MGPSGVREIRRKCAPASTGESTSEVSDTVWKVISEPCSLVTGKGVPKCHPEGSFKEAVKRTSSVFLPWGYSTTWFQLSISSCVVAEAPEEKPSGGAGITRSRRASRVLVPAGTGRWKVDVSARLRRDATRCPLAKNCSPGRSGKGPVGPRPPRIHLG